MSPHNYVEEYLPDKIKNKFKLSDEIRQIYDPSQWFIECWKPHVKVWYKIQEKAISEKKISIGYIGEGKCMLFKINDVINIYKNALIDDPFGLYEIEN